MGGVMVMQLITSSFPFRNVFLCRIFVFVWLGLRYLLISHKEGCWT